MYTLKLFSQNSRPKILCLGAHPDDIEMGCGATLLKIMEETKADFYWVVFSGNELRHREAIVSAEAFLEKAESKKIIAKDFRDSYFPFIGEKIKNYFEELKDDFQPDMIFTHYRNDLHQDHRLLSKLTWNAFRDHFILEYELPKYDGDLTTPNLYVYIQDYLAEKKIRLIIDGFPSQKEKRWFDKEAFQAILRIRGIESNSPSKYAEAFHCRKIVF